jgi:hypothetical protein
MDKRKIYYLIHSGKNSNLKYYVRSYLHEATPRWFTQWQGKRILKQLDTRKDCEEIFKRVDYYNQLNIDSPIDQRIWQSEAVKVKNQPMTGQSSYYHDAIEIARFFSSEYKWILVPGDTIHVPEAPSIVKSRPLVENNINSVLLKLDKNRHFLFVNDHKPWSEKRNVAIFRGDLGPYKPNRDLFINRWEGHPMVDAASTNRSEEHPEWQKGKLTIGEHLDYKFIMSLEGNDVASNLKWVMSSNSIAVTPKLKRETWFMEGTLIPNYHYIEVREDFEDLEERLQYYIEHPNEAAAIIHHAHEYVRQFQDAEREKLISLLVLKRYFEVTNGSHGD